MTYDKALDIIMPAYDFLICGTSGIEEIEQILIAMLIKKGVRSANARRYVNQFLGE